MTIHEATTHLAAAEVVERARTFFAGIRSPNAAAEEARGTMHLRFHLDMGEIVIGAIPVEGGTRVRGSGSRGAALISRFLTTLPPAIPSAVERPHRARAA